MNIKGKRQIVIVIVLAVAILLPLAVLRTFGLKPEIPGGLQNIFFWIYFPSFYAASFARQCSGSYILQYSVFAITYIATYLSLAWIIARLIYPNKKVHPESTVSDEPKK